VVVQEYRSKTVFVVGEVSRRGSYPFAGQGMSLVEVLAKAGPMTVNAGAEVVVVRPRPGTDVTGPVLPFEVTEGEDSDGRLKIVRRRLFYPGSGKNADRSCPRAGLYSSLWRPWRRDCVALTSSDGAR